MRERLIELLNKKYDHFCDQCGVNKDSHYTESLADHLLANGVIVPPCKVGDKVYHICKSTQDIEVGKIESISYWYDGYFLFSLDMGNYSIGLGVDEIFLTKEEAENILKERERE